MGAADASPRVWLVLSHDGRAGEEMLRRLARGHRRSVEWTYPSRTYESWRPREYLGIRILRFTADSESVTVRGRP